MIYNIWQMAERGDSRRISYIKPGMAVGGASMADVALLTLLGEMGVGVDVHTGYLDGRIELMLEKGGFKVSVNPMLDRDCKFLSEIDGVHNVDKALERVIGQSAVTIVSQSFLGDADIFNTALLGVLNRVKGNGSFLRTHDYIRDQEKFRLVTKSQSVMGLPVTGALEQWMKCLNGEANVDKMPHFISKESFYRDSAKLEARDIRQHLGITKEDFVIFQPSRVDPRKRIGKAVYLAASLQKMMPERKVVLLVAGGGEPIEEHKKEKGRLIRHASEFGYENMVFLNGLVGDERHRRVSDYMRPGVADVVTFMSGIDAFGLPPLESCIAQIPCVTSSFKDERGYPSFADNYKGFSFLIDDDEPDRVSEATVENVVRIAKDPCSMSEALRKNYELANERYSVEAIKTKLIRLLRPYNII